MIDGIIQSVDHSDYQSITQSVQLSFSQQRSDYDSNFWNSNLLVHQSVSQTNQSIFQVFNCLDPSVNQSVNQINQSIVQVFDTLTHQSVNQTKQSIVQVFNALIHQSVHQSVNQSISQLITNHCSCILWSGRQ